LAGAAGDADGDMQDPVAEGVDLAVARSGCSVKPISVDQVTRSVAARMISSQAAFVSPHDRGGLFGLSVVVVVSR
jgi:hypothetical protein